MNAFMFFINEINLKYKELAYVTQFNSLKNNKLLETN